jgi:hypothetical protein
MNKKILIIFIALVGILIGCEKDEDQVLFTPTDVTAPSLVTVPDLALERESGDNILVFEGTPVNPGFTVSANYFLEAGFADSNFSKVALLYNGTSVDEIELTVNELNNALLNVFPEDQTTNIELRLRAELLVEAGPTAPGTGENRFEYISQTVTDQITIFGLLRLDLVDLDQKIVSRNSDSIYQGIVNLTAGQTFQVNNPETGLTYGLSGAAVVEDGVAFEAEATGDHLLIVNLTDGTYELTPWSIGLIGPAQPGEWSEDTDMTYNPSTKKWEITIELADADFKFRANDDWAWNLGGVDDANSTNLDHGGEDLRIGSGAGTYFIELTVTEYYTDEETGTYTAEKK